MAFHRNQVELIGNVGADPEVRYLPNGNAVANIRLATTEKWKDKESGEMKEATEWHRISVFGRLAEIANEYVKKGSHIFVVGKIKTRKYQAQDGTDRYSTEIQVSELGLLGSPRNGDGSQGGETRQPRTTTAARPAAQPAGGGFDEMDDDIPF
jgi:single-strand DNA-binding protein